MPRKVGAIVALIGLALVLAGAFTKAWFTGKDARASVSFGLLGMEVCEQGRCMSIDYDAVGRRDRDLKQIGQAGMAAVGGSVLLAVVAAFAAVMALARPLEPARGAGIATSVLGVMAVLGALAVVMVGSDVWKRASLGYSAFLYFAGAAALVVAGVLVSRRT